jgi:hypothetical protein
VAHGPQRGDEDHGKARDLAAKAVGVSPRSVERARGIAEKAPDLVEKVKAGKVYLQEGASRAG